MTKLPTLQELIIKVYNGEIQMDKAITFAIENIAPVNPHYNEDGLYLNVLEPENVIDLLQGGVMRDLYDYETYSTFVEGYVEGREEQGKNQVRG